MFDQLLDQLDMAEVGEKEFNPMTFAPTDYADLDKVLAHIRNRTTLTEISLPQLSLNGRVIKDDMDRYLKHPSVSSSALKEILKTPLHYYCYINEPVTKRVSKAFDLGTFCHTAFLEPALFDNLLVEPEASQNTTEGVDKLIVFWEKIARKNQNSVTPRRRIVSAARQATKRAGLKLEKIDGKRDYLAQLRKRVGKVCVDERTFRIVSLIKRHYYTYGGGIIPNLLKGAAFETSFYGKDNETGLPVKVRPDAFNIEENCGANVVISFKTTSADTIEKFQYDAARYKYHLSEGMYLDVMTQVTGRRFNGVICVMLQTVAPYLPAVFWWDAEDLANGRYRYRCALQAVRDCIDAKAFPGFDANAAAGNQGIIEMKLPEWTLKELLNISIEN